MAVALSDECRRIYVDHRGFGRSDKPHEPEAYTTAVRVADVVAAMDAMELERAHIIGASWGARLAFGIGEYARNRVLSLTMGGQVPYAMDVRGPLVGAVTKSMEAEPSERMRAFANVLISFGIGESSARVLEDKRPRGDPCGLDGCP